MKKKILLMLVIISVLCLLLALSVSATRVEDYNDTFTLQSAGQIVHYQKWFYNEGKSYVRKGYTDNITITFIDEEGQPLTEVAMWEYDEEEGKYYSLVWYISDYELFWEDQTYSDSNVGEQTYPKYTSATYTLSKARAVDLRYVTSSINRSHDVWVDADGNKITKTLEALRAIYHTNGTPDDTSDDIRLQHSQGIGRDTDNYGYFGYDAQFAATGNKIVVGNFRDCDFQSDIEGNYGTSNTWSRADNIQCLWYPDTMVYMYTGVGPVYEVDVGEGMEIIDCQILRDNKRVKEFIIPNSTLYICHEAFRGSDLTKLTIGEGLFSHGNEPYLYTGGADIVVMSKNLLNSAYTGTLRNLLANNAATILFDGTKAEAEALVAKIQSGNSSYNTVAYYDYNTTTERESKNGLAIFYNYNRCEAFFRGQHANGVVKEFANGPLANGTCTEGCTRVGCGISVTTDIPAVFVNPGFSVPEFEGKKVILQEYGINYTSLELYNSLYEDKIIGFGVLAGTKAKLGDVTEIFGADGKVCVDGVAYVSVSERAEKYDLFQMKVAGLEGSDDTNGAYADLALYCCGYYLTSNGETTDSFYMNEGVATATLPTAVSYNSVVASKKESEEK